MGNVISPLGEYDWGVLGVVTNKELRAREVAAAYYGKAIQEVVDSGESAMVARALMRLQAHGYVGGGYYETSVTRTYSLTDKGCGWLAMGQAA